MPIMAAGLFYLCHLPDPRLANRGLRTNSVLAPQQEWVREGYLATRTKLGSRSILDFPLENRRSTAPKAPAFRASFPGAMHGCDGKETKLFSCLRLTCGRFEGHSC